MKNEIKNADQLIQEFPKWNEVVNKNEIKHFIDNAISILIKNGTYQPQDYMSIFNCVLTLDELFSKLKERNCYYKETNKTIKNKELEILNEQLKANESLIINLSKQLKTTNTHYYNLIERIKTLDSRIENKKKEITLLNSRYEKNHNEIEKKFKQLQKSKYDKEKQELELVKLRQEKIDIEERFNRNILKLEKEKERFEDEVWQLKSTIPDASNSVSSISEKINKYKERKQELEKEKIIIEESMNYNYISISKNGQAYTNEVYSIKSFIKDVQDLLNNNGLTPLSRIKIESLLQDPNQEKEVDIFEKLEKLAAN